MRKDVEKLVKLLPQMEKRFRHARRRYRSLASRAKRAVVRWEWCSGPRYSHQPFGPERAGWRGRVLNKAPAKKRGIYRYGFSSDGRVLVEEQYTQFKDRKKETFWEYSQGRIDSTAFDHFPEKWPINIESTFFADGVAQGFIRYGERGLSVEAYEYRNSVLVCVHEAGREHDSAKAALDFMDEHLSYRDGQLVKMVRKWKRGGTETVTIAPDRRTTLDLRLDAEKIGAYIHARVAKQRKQAGTAAVRRIDLGFGYGESSFVSLHFDTRPDAQPDGEWCKHIEASQLEFPHWSQVAAALGAKPVRLVQLDGTERQISEGEDFDDEAVAALFGEMLKHVLLSARASGIFKQISKAKGCELGVEELEGHYGWPAYKDRGKENLA